MRKMPDLAQAKDYILGRLQQELSPALTYHSLEHTINEVVPAVELLARGEHVSGVDRLLLVTAAYYHDAGFIYQRQGHESVSIQIAEQVLPAFGYSAAHLAVIRSIIETTRIPQTPTDVLGRIMADADLDYLGKANFWKRSDDLRQELAHDGTQFSDLGWYIFQLSFIRAHRYFTQTAQQMREPRKQQHILEIRKRLARALQVDQGPIKV